MVPMIEASGLTHRYGRDTALRDVELTVPEGALYALLGPNGAGKTTLLKILLGLLRPTAGPSRWRSCARASRFATPVGAPPVEGTYPWLRDGWMHDVEVLVTGWVPVGTYPLRVERVPLVTRPSR